MNRFVLNSLLDTDLYKLTMGQIAFKKYRNLNAVHRFTLRSDNVDLGPLYGKINQEMEHYCSLKFTQDELKYLKNLNYFEEEYLQFLEGFQPKFSHLSIQRNSSVNGGIEIESKGSWAETIFFEVPILSLINELYYLDRDAVTHYQEGERRLEPKVEALKRLADDFGLQGQGLLVEFGTRRRFRGEWHDRLLNLLKQGLGDLLGGTSNVALAQKHSLSPMGTMAHEYIQAFQVISDDLANSQSLALTTWLEQYGEMLNCALSDTLGTDLFLKEFDGELAERFNALRHDSGSPLAWVEKVWQHYMKLNLDPAQKTVLFSDGLNMEQVEVILKFMMDRKIPMQPRFGIGTNLTHDVGLRPLSVVMKLVELDGQPVCKISDDPGKISGVSPEYLERLRQTFGEESIPEIDPIKQT